MNKTKRILIKTSGVLLIILGLVAFFTNIGGAISLCFYYKSISGLSHVDFSVWLLIIASCILLIIPGILLYSFKKYAQIWGIFSYTILFMLGLLVASYMMFYFGVAKFLTLKNLQSFFCSPAGAVLLIVNIIPLFFIVVLFNSNEEFTKGQANQ